MFLTKKDLDELRNSLQQINKRLDSLEDEVGDMKFVQDRQRQGGFYGDRGMDYVPTGGAFLEKRGEWRRRGMLD